MASIINIMENEKNDGVIRRVLTSEVKWILGVVMFVFGIAGPYYGMKQDIALIQKDISVINMNHEVHIQDILQDQKEMKQQIIELQKQLIIIGDKKN